MFKVLVTPRRGVDCDAALRVATEVAKEQGFEISDHKFANGSGQLVLFVKGQRLPALQLFTRKLREEHKTTFTYVSAAKEA